MVMWSLLDLLRPSLFEALRESMRAASMRILDCPESGRAGWVLMNIDGEPTWINLRESEP